MTDEATPTDEFEFTLDGRTVRARKGEKLIAAAEGLSVPSPFGEIVFRKIDHQSTLGAFVGKTALKDGKGVMVDSVYRKGSDYLPDDAEVAKMRPKE